MSNSIYQQIAEIISLIEANHLEQLSLGEVAQVAEVSPTYLQKVFTAWVGISPKQFGRYMNLSYARQLLAQNSTLERTAQATGLSGTGRLHDLFVDIEAMTPGEYKAKGEGLVISYTIFDSPFGLCLVATTNRGVCNVLFGNSTDDLIVDLAARWPHAARHKQHSPLQQPVIDFISGIETKKRIKVHLHGTNFQLKVWEALLLIREGSISSYGSIARQIGQPTYARAVGAAVGDNPIGYLIPCHRVLQSTGALSGYRWGVDRKRMMLEYEAIKTQTD